MENVNLKLNKISFLNKEKKIVSQKKMLFILNIIIIFLIIIIIKLKIKLKRIIKSYENIQNEQINTKRKIELITNENNEKNKIIKILEKKNEINKKYYEIYKNYSEINKKHSEINKNNLLFYKEMLQLYIENRTQFYIRGREYIMKLENKIYNDSNINTIQDKLNWLIIHESPEYKAKIVDKILLHEYSKKLLGKDICVPIIKIYNNTDELNLNELPNKFVLKYNHGSSMNIICNNKSNFNINDAKKLLNQWKNINYGLKGFEYQYLNVKRKFFVEKYLSDDIKDYKIYCFNGEPKFIRVQKNLSDNSGKINNYYNLDWTLNEIETNLPHYFRKPEIKFKKPKNLKLMLQYAKKLSKEFAFVRVDLYEIEDIVYLGELTFTPFNIRMNYKDNNQSLWLGSFLDLKIKNNYSISFPYI